MTNKTQARAEELAESAVRELIGSEWWDEATKRLHSTRTGAADGLKPRLQAALTGALMAAMNEQPNHYDDWLFMQEVKADNPKD